MTRLIDADLLEKEIYKWMPKDQETWMDSEIPPIENLVISIMMTIQEQPTVEAISIDFLIDFLNEKITELLESWRENQQTPYGFNIPPTQSQLTTQNKKVIT